MAIEGVFLMFSVVIPAYNAEKFIMRSVKSVLDQTHTDFELIIVDDGSSDGTKKQLEQLSDERIRYIYQENGGVSAARNKGIIESKGQYVCFLDSDDEWMPNHLAVMLTLIEKYSNCGMYVTGYDIRLGNGEVIHKSQQILRAIVEEDFERDNGYELLNDYGYFLNTNTVCCRRSVFDKVGLFADGVKNGEDDDMWYRLFAYYPLAISKAVTTVYDRANCGATGQRGDVFETYFLMRVDGLLSSSEIPQHRKKALLIWRERNSLSRARKYILAGNKREAVSIMKTINYKKVKKKKVFETFLCLCLPYKLVRKVIDKRDATYYR